MIRRFLVPLAVVAGLTVALAAPAGAHVTVGADGAEPGSFTVLTFRVPNEEADASTVGLKVQFPVDHPIAFVSVQPKPGWTIETTEVDLDTPIEAHGDEITSAVGEIEWSGGEIAPGEFDMFNVSAGPLPTDTDTLTFKAIQTYEDADGTTHDVSWIQEVGDDGTEPEHPAPVLELTGAGDDTAVSSDDAHTAADGASADTDTPTVTGTEVAGTSDDSSDGTATAALVIAIIGLVVALGGVGLGLSRRRTASGGAGSGD